MQNSGPMEETYNDSRTATSEKKNKSSDQANTGQMQFGDFIISSKTFCLLRLADFLIIIPFYKKVIPLKT